MWVTHILLYLPFQANLQIMCVDQRCSIPLSEDIPLLVTCCFFTVNYL